MIILVYFIFIFSALEILPFLILAGSVFLYTVMYWASLYQVVRVPQTDVNPFKPSGSGIFQFLHHSYPSVILAATFNLILVFYNWFFVFLLIGFGSLKGLFSPKMIKNSFMYKALFRSENSKTKN
jgi:hypothetical protein